MEIYTKAIANVVEGEYSNEYLEKMEYLIDKSKTANVAKSLPKITKQKNEELFNILLGKHYNGHFSIKQAPIGEKLNNGKDKFTRLNLINQCIVLYNILLIGFTNNGVDLRNIGGSKSSGKTLVSKNISDKESFVLILQSPTGMFERRINLLKV